MLTSVPQLGSYFTLRNYLISCNEMRPRDCPVKNSMTIQTKLHQALEKQRAGELAEAAETYNEILRIDSAHPDALHLLGLIESSRGNHQQAVALIQQAVTLTPLSPVMHSNLGVVLRHAQRHG